MTKHRASSFLSTLTFGIPFALAACATVDDPPDPTDDPPEVIAARAHLADTAPEIAPSDLEVTRDRSDDLGMTHVRQQQRVDGIPVIGGEAIVHLAADGSLSSITDHLVRDLQVDTQPTVDADAAIGSALDATVGAGHETATPTAELRILRDRDGDHLVWQVAIESLPADDADAWTKPIVLVDAHSGAVLHQRDRVEDVNVNATGNARYAGTVAIKNWQDASGYWLEDDVRKVGTYTLSNGQPGDGVAHFKNASATWSSFTTAVQAEWALARTWDYYHSTFGRSGIDGNNGPGYVNSLGGVGTLQSGLISWGSGTNNAKWIDPEMIFGDGDGTTFSPLVSLDIVAHEWTHGVTSREVGLDGLNETPALNEHLSDVFGASAEAFDAGGASSNTWLMGEQAYTPGTAGDALRYLGDPAKDGISLDLWSSTLDQRDGHDGAGVGNLAFYLTVNGGSHPRRASCHVTGVGLDKVQRVWYRALTEYLTSNANYTELRQATLLAATDLYGAGSSTYRALDSAWEAVGIPDVQVFGFPNRHYGSLTTGQNAFLPSSSGFWSSSGSVTGFLGHDQSNDFDLELWRQDPTTHGWSRVYAATGPGNNEVISYASGTGTQYRWVVKATSGSGAYDLGWK